MGIMVLVGIFVKINKHTGWNKCTGGNYNQTKSKSKPLSSLTQISILHVSIIISHSNKKIANLSNLQIKDQMNVFQNCSLIFFKFLKY